jgi:tetrahydromethanopterin S-methyltransferase subunit C
MDRNEVFAAAVIVVLGLLVVGGVAGSYTAQKYFDYKIKETCIVETKKINSCLGNSETFKVRD